MLKTANGDSLRMVNSGAVVQAAALLFVLTKESSRESQ